MQLCSVSVVTPLVSRMMFPSELTTLGIRKDLNLVGTNYSTLSSIFYVGWLLWALPGNLIMAKFPLSKYLGLNVSHCLRLMRGIRIDRLDFPVGCLFDRSRRIKRLQGHAYPSTYIWSFRGRRKACLCESRNEQSGQNTQRLTDTD